MFDLSNTMIHLIAAGGGEGKEAHPPPSFWATMIYLGITLGVIFLMMAIAKKDFGNRVFKSRVAQLFEQLYLFIENMCLGIIGPHGRKYIPMIMSFWMIIFVANIIALFFPYSVTADIGFNLGMALISIGYVQYEGIRSNGFAGHFSHFAGPKLGGAMVIVSAMIFIIELISEVMKNVSLSLRLFGNIEGGHMVTDALNKVGSDLIMIGDIGIGFPFGALLLPIKVLTCVVQALIFSLLTCVYISLVTHHEGDHSHGEEHVPAH